MNNSNSFLNILDLSRDELAQTLELATRLTAERGHSEWRPLKDQTWALLFHKSSTRTRVSFEVGIHELGGHAMILDQNRMQTGRGETIEDTAKVLSRYLHGLVIRTFEQSIIEEFANKGTIPVVNALTDSFHPCQVVSDLFTISERFGKEGNLLDSLNGRKLVYFGDCASNMAHSLILGGAVAGMEIVLCGPEGFAPDPMVETCLREAGLPVTYVFTTDPGSGAAGADVVYTDVWISMGDEEESDKRLQLMEPYQVNSTVMGNAAESALFMHCLPAHEGQEVSSEVYKGRQSIVFDQAENRLHAQKAILSLLTGK